MPIIPGYNDSITPQGDIRAQASPEDFGASVGAATEQFGHAAFAEGSDFLLKVEQDRGRIWAFDAASTQRKNLEEGLRSKVNGLDPNDPQFTNKLGSLVDDVSKDVDTATATLLDQAPSRSARRLVASHMAFTKNVLVNSAMNERSRIEGQMTAIQAQDGLKAAQDQVAADPSNDNYKRTVDQLKQHIYGFTSIDPSMKLKWAEDAEHNAAVTQVQSLVSRDAEGFLKTVNPQGGHMTPTGIRGAMPSGAPTAPDPDSVFSKVLQQESGNNQSAVSSKGAVGIAQIMPSTGPEAAALAGLPWDPEKFKSDPAYNSALGKAYFKSMLQRFGSYDKAFAAYNAGPSKTAALIQQYGNNWLQHAPAETQAYVASLTKAAGVEKEALNLTTPDYPQVDPMTDTDIAKSEPSIAGWGKLTWSEKINAVRQAEAALGNRMASERGAMDRDFKDATSTLLDGKDYPGLDSARFGLSNFQKLYGGDEGQRRFDQLQYARGIGHFVAQMGQMPYDQAAAFLSKNEPQGGPEYAAKSPVWDMAAKAFDQVQQARNKDFMGWASQNNMPGYQPLDWSDPSKLATSVSSRVALANTGRNDFKANAHLFSKDEAGQLAAAMNQYPPKQQMEVLKALKAGAGDWFPDALAQVAPHSPAVAFAGALSGYDGQVQTQGGKQDSSLVGQYILEGAHILDGKEIDGKEAKGSRAFRLDDKAFANMFWNTVGPDAFSSPDAQRSAAAAGDTMQAVKNYLVADMVHRGVNPQQLDAGSVQNAVKAVTGGVVKSPNGDSLFVPWGMDPDWFQKQMPIAVQAALSNAGLKGTKFDNPDAFRYMNVDDGRYMVLNGNRQPLYGRMGPVIVDMRQMAKSAPAPAPTLPTQRAIEDVSKYFRRGADY